jgi:hypothetical protein
MDCEDAIPAFQLTDGTEVPVDNQRIDEKGRIISDTLPRKSSTSFKALGVPMHTVLKFTRDENITCKVCSDSEVEYQGKKSTLSPLAKRLMKKRGYDWKQYNGLQFFKYKNQTLWQIKNNLAKNLGVIKPAPVKKPSPRTGKSSR